MKRCYIITAYMETNLTDLIRPGSADYIICADGGYEIAASFGITPDLVIGDSDSGNMAAFSGEKPKALLFPREKDESDTFLCVKHAAGLGFDEIVILGGIGGRLDHTIANIQVLSYFSGLIKSLRMSDGRNTAIVTQGPEITLKRREGFTVSLFALSEKCCGVTTTGLRYPLTDAELSNSFPLGLSNAFTREEATIGLKSGKLLIVMSRE